MEYGSCSRVRANDVLQMENRPEWVPHSVHFLSSTELHAMESQQSANAGLA